MYYFAYGSNMFKKRIEDRLKSVNDFGLATLKGYKIKFNKQSKDGSGKTNIISDNKSNTLGVIYDLTEQQMILLDKSEIGYERIKIKIDLNSIIIDAEIYIANIDTINENLLPTNEYLNYLIKGAIEHKFPEEYIEYLKSIEYKK